VPDFHRPAILFHYLTEGKHMLTHFVFDAGIHLACMLATIIRNHGTFCPASQHCVLHSLHV
jgi:hypothetical protein